jgi:hypothetical protein
MSAKPLAARTFARATEPTVATDHPAPDGTAADLQFREGLWCEYRREALGAGLSAAQATEYATALSSAMGYGGVSEMAPAGCNWFYQSQARVVRRTITSGLIELTHGGRSNAIGRITAAGASKFTRGFRWWNAGGKS